MWGEKLNSNFKVDIASLNQLRYARVGTKDMLIVIMFFFLFFFVEKSTINQHYGLCLRFIESMKNTIINAKI